MGWLCHHWQTPLERHPCHQLARLNMTCDNYGMPEPAGDRRSFPLSALFILMAACSVVAALMAPLSRAIGEGKIGVSQAAEASACGAILVMMLGAVIGLYHHRPARGLGWGILTGGGIGMVMGPVVLSPQSAFPSLLTMSVGGAAALLAVSAIFRGNARQ